MHSATPAATAHLAAYSPDGLVYGPLWDGLTVSVVGFHAAGAEAQTARQAVQYLARGGNLLDAGAQPAAVGAAVTAAIAAGHAQRERLVLCAEGAAAPAEAASLLAAGLITPADLLGEDCFAPSYLRHQVRRALGQLGLRRLDLFWLAGADALYAAVAEAEFRERLREALAALEVACAQGELTAYGLALNAPLFPPALALEIAQDVLGARHHLRALRLPLTAAARLADPTPLAVLATTDTAPLTLPPGVTALLTPRPLAA